MLFTEDQNQVIDDPKTREDLLREVLVLRRRVVELEARETCVDASGNTTTAEAQRDLEERFSVLVDNSHEGIHIAQEGMLKFVNPALARMYGQRQETLLSRPFTEFIHPDDRELVLDRSLRRAKGEELPSRYPHRVVTEKGTTRWVEINSAATTWEGKPAVLVFSTDITERKQMEEAIKERDEQYRALVEESFDGIMITSATKIIFANSRLCQMLGYPLEELKRMDHWLTAHPDFRDVVHERALARMRGESVPPNYELKFQRKDGSVFDGEVQARAIDIQGEQGVQVWIRDITERKRAEQALRETERRLLQAQKMEAVGTLTGGIAHDFNNMLTVILGYAELLLSDVDENHPSRADLQKIIDTAAGGASLVQRLLTYSRQADISLGTLDVKSEVEKVTEILLRTIPRMISLELRLAEDVESIYGDPAQIQQVMMNLALNAAEAMENEGKLIIGAENTVLDDAYCSTRPGVQPGDYVLITVSDTGHGMDRQTMERMYDPFFSTKARGSERGTGLGLAVVHSIVEQHGGHINCYSMPDKGTSFELCFPVLKTEPQPEVIREKPSSQSGTQTILLVDDENLIRDLGERILTRAGYKVLTASNGREALDIYRKSCEGISLVLLDLIMPEMGGRKCISELLKINPGVKILVCTGYSSVDDASAQATAALVSGLIRKPFTTSNLLQTVREILVQP